MLGFVGTVAVAPPLHACVQPALFHLTNLMRISSYLSLPLSLSPFPSFAQLTVVTVVELPSSW